MKVRDAKPQGLKFRELLSKVSRLQFILTVIILLDENLNVLIYFYLL